MTKIDKIAVEVVNHCRNHNPEELDQIFDKLPVGLTPKKYQNLYERLLAKILFSLKEDIDTLSWFCGYFASEINHSEDNKLNHPITELSKILIQSNMQPFVDFIPYPGSRLVIANTDKFESLPREVKDLMQDLFSVIETSGEEAKEINDALLQELVVNEE